MKYRIDDVKRVLQNKDFNTFVHGCNAQGKFRSGIAGIVREVYPDAKKNYEAAIKDGNIELGTINSMYIVRDDLPKMKVILNGITQEDFGYDGKRYASYDAIDTLFKNIAFHTRKDKNEQSVISYPLIGCGLGGLQWDVVKEIIDYRLKGLNHECILRFEDIVKYNIRELIN